MTADARVGRRMRRRKLPVGVTLGRIAGRVVIWVLILLGVVVAVAPFMISLYLAILPYDIPIVPYQWHIDKWTWEGFSKAWTLVEVGLYGQNSLFYATVNATITTLLATTVGYAFARMQFPFKKPMWGLLLVGMMLPGMVTLAPRYTMMIRWPLAGGNGIAGRGGSGLYDTWWGLLLPGLMSASSSFLMRQFFQTLPGDLEDAARVDGAGEWRIYSRIMLPMAVPGVVTTFMFQFQGAWNELAWPQMIVTSREMRTLAVGITYISQVLTYGSDPSYTPMNWVQAASIVMALPIIVLFTVGQRWFVRGISLTGIK